MKKHQKGKDGWKRYRTEEFRFRGRRSYNSAIKPLKKTKHQRNIADHLTNYHTQF